MELAIYNKNGISTELVSFAEKTFKSPIISKLSENQQLDTLETLIAKTFLDCGQKIVVEDLVSLSNEVQESIQNEFSWITLTEIEIAFKKGRRKEFLITRNNKQESLDWFGLNKNTFEQWIIAYKSQFRDKELRDRSKKAKDSYVKPTDEQNKKAIDNAIVECVLSVTNTGKLPTGKLYLYYHLYKSNCLPEHTKKFRENVRRKVIKNAFKGNFGGEDILKKFKKSALIKFCKKNDKSEDEIVKILKQKNLTFTRSDQWKSKKEIKNMFEDKTSLKAKCREQILLQYFQNLINA